MSSITCKLFGHKFSKREFVKTGNCRHPLTGITIDAGYHKYTHYKYCQRCGEENKNFNTTNREN
jgi:hypothetical protein